MRFENDWQSANRIAAFKPNSHTFFNLHKFYYRRKNLKFRQPKLSVALRTPTKTAVSGAPAKKFKCQNSASVQTNNFKAMIKNY